MLPQVNGIIDNVPFEINKRKNHRYSIISVNQIIKNNRRCLIQLMLKDRMKKDLKEITKISFVEKKGELGDGFSKMRYVLLFFLLFSFVGGTVKAQIVQQTTAGTNYSYVVPAGVTSIAIEVWGGGGAGASITAANTRGAGGGGGAYNKLTLNVTPGQTYYYQVGAGGVPNGANGQASWFGPNQNGTGALVTANGATNGSNTTAGTGGTAGTGRAGGNGAVNAANATGSGGSSAGPFAPGNTPGAGTNAGVAVSGGGGGGAGHNVANGVGNNGFIPGGGGSGAYRTTGASPILGGAGGNGMVVIQPANATYAYHGTGSKDLYKLGAVGNRALLVSRLPTSNQNFDPFPNWGRTYVYARAGEKIHVGSSAQGLVKEQTGTINLYAPNSGQVFTSGNSTTAGRINSRVEELAGPKSASNPNGYTSYSITVPAGQEGVWVVEFVSPSNAASGNTTQTNINMQSDAFWNIDTQNMITFGSYNGSAFIVSWDATVTSAADVPVTGRTYTTVFNGSIYFDAATPLRPDGFYGKFYALTSDGFVYDVDNNGQNGLSFNFFVNNKGVVNQVDTDPTPTYKSLSNSTYAGISPRIWDPRNFDNVANNHITHKMFYALPDPSMPVTTNIWDISGATSRSGYWLKPIRVNPKMTDLAFVGSEGTLGQSGPKGGYVIFNSNVNGRYEVVIPLPAPYTTRYLRGPAVVGANRIYWDGYDGASPAVKVGMGVSLSSISTQLAGAEVHFPLIDVENNPNGMILELLDNAYNYFSPSKDRVFWDNDNISGAPAVDFDNTTGGSPSKTNGHKWGAANTANNNFGDNKTIDTWSYAPGEVETITGLSIELKTADLEVVSITKTAGPASVQIGDQLNYEVLIRNNGPIDAVGSRTATFFLYMPLGASVNPALATFTPVSGGAQLRGTATFGPLSAVNVYKIEVDMPNGSEGRFSFPVTITGNTPANVNMWAAIMRNNDVEDPNATNYTITIEKPRDPFEEANGIHTPVESLNLNVSAANMNTAFPTLAISNPANTDFTNNIKYNNSVVSTTVVSTTLSIEKTGSRQGTATGNAATFYVTVTNTGAHPSTNTTLTDNLAGTRFNFTMDAAQTNYYTTQGTVSYSLPNGTAGLGNITWQIGTLAPGASATIAFRTNNAASGDWTNTASVVSNEVTTPVTSSVTLSTNVTPVDIGVVKSVENHPTDPNKVIFKVVASIPSGASTSGVKIRDVLPIGYTYVTHTAAGNGYSETTGVWDIGVMSNAAGITKELSIEATINPPTGTTNEYLNNARIIAASTPDLNLLNNRSSAEIKADLRVDKTVDKANPMKGDLVVFTITAANLARTGYQHATGVQVIEKLPDGFTYVSHGTLPAGTTFSFDNATSTGTWVIGNLSTGASRSLEITARVLNTGSYVNTATVSGGQRDDAPLNNVSTVTLTPITPSLFITNPMIYQRIINN